MHRFFILPVAFAVVSIAAHAEESLHPRSEHRIEVARMFNTITTDITKFEGQFALYQDLIEQRAGTFVSMPSLSPHYTAWGFDIAYSTGDWRYAAFGLASSHFPNTFGYYESDNTTLIRQGETEQNELMAGVECGWYMLAYDHFYIYPYASLFVNATECAFTEQDNRQSIAHTALGGALGMAVDIRAFPVYVAEQSFVDITLGLRLHYNQPLVSLHESQEGPMLVPISSSGVQFGAHGTALQVRLALAYNY